jgi:HSP20 family protein
MARPGPSQSEPAAPASRADLMRPTVDLARFPAMWEAVTAAFDDVFAPRADVEETDDAYLIELDLPGVRRRDVEVTVQGRRLVVVGERKEKERVGVLRRRTRNIGKFRYELVLPSEIDESDIEAHLDAGVMALRLPKAHADRPRRITVS